MICMYICEVENDDISFHSNVVSVRFSFLTFYTLKTFKDCIVFGRQA